MEIIMIVLWIAAGAAAVVLAVVAAELRAVASSIRNTAGRLASNASGERARAEEAGALIARMEKQAEGLKRIFGYGAGRVAREKTPDSTPFDFIGEPDEARRAREMRAFYEGIESVLGYDGRRA